MTYDTQQVQVAALVATWLLLCPSQSSTTNLVTGANEVIINKVLVIYLDKFGSIYVLSYFVSWFTHHTQVTQI